MVLLLACSVENGISGEKDRPRGFDTSDTFSLPVDTESQGETDTPSQAPTALITAPEPGALIEGCDGVELVGVVQDGDTPVDQLVATWSADGTVLWTGLPEADGTTRLAWDPGDGAWAVTLDVVDPTGLTGQDSRGFTLAPPSTTPAFTWSRSAMEDRVAATTTGTCIADALALPTDPAWVWDSGDYTPAVSAADGLAAGRTWASWDQVNTVDCHLIELEVTVPECGDFGALQIASPWYSGIPINDNVYVVVDGVVVLQSGTTLGAGHGGPAETDTWMAEGAEIPVVALSPGVNVVQFVVEEYASWGGLGYLEPRLVK